MCILLMLCIICGAFLLGGLLFSRSVSTILQLVVEVKAQAENTKKSISWSRETVRAKSESLMLTSFLLLNEL